MNSISHKNLLKCRRVYHTHGFTLKLSLSAYNLGQQPWKQECNSILGRIWDDRCKQKPNPQLIKLDSISKFGNQINLYTHESSNTQYALSTNPGLTILLTNVKAKRLCHCVQFTEQIQKKKNYKSNDSKDPSFQTQKRCYTGKKIKATKKAQKVDLICTSLR